MSKFDKARYQLQKKAGRHTRSFPMATISYYGPDNMRASKVVVGIFFKPDDLAEMKKWFSDEGDLRFSSETNQEILDYLLEKHVECVVMPDRLIGCPHEEGIDYPDGAVCPQCPYWAGRDRFSGVHVN